MQISTLAPSVYTHARIEWGKGVEVDPDQQPVIRAIGQAAMIFV